jgi:hypothetical protein
VSRRVRLGSMAGTGWTSCSRVSIRLAVSPTVTASQMLAGRRAVAVDARTGGSASRPCHLGNYYCEAVHVTSARGAILTPQRSRSRRAGLGAVTDAPSPRCVYRAPRAQKSTRNLQIWVIGEGRCRYIRPAVSSVNECSVGRVLCCPRRPGRLASGRRACTNEMVWRTGSS